MQYKCGLYNGKKSKISVFVMKSIWARIKFNLKSDKKVTWFTSNNTTWVYKMTKELFSNIFCL